MRLDHIWSPRALAKWSSTEAGAISSAAGPSREGAWPAGLLEPGVVEANEVARTVEVFGVRGELRAAAVRDGEEVMGLVTIA